MKDSKAPLIVTIAGGKTRTFNPDLSTHSQSPVCTDRTELAFTIPAESLKKALIGKGGARYVPALSWSVLHRSI